MRRHGPLSVIMHYPTTEKGRLELANRMAEVHADAVCRRIRELTCPDEQKLQLLDTVIESAKQRAKQQEQGPPQHIPGDKPTRQ